MRARIRQNAHWRRYGRRPRLALLAILRAGAGRRHRHRHAARRRPGLQAGAEIFESRRRRASRYRRTGRAAAEDREVQDVTCPSVADAYSGRHSRLTRGSMLNSRVERFGLRTRRSPPAHHREATPQYSSRAAISRRLLTMGQLPVMLARMDEVSALDIGAPEAAHQPRHPRPGLAHDQRHLQRAAVSSCAANLRHRPHHVLGQLSLCPQCKGS
jgi:hypothetical protein